MLQDWSDDYLLGIEEIDAQHKGFFEATHRLYEAILNCEGEKAVEGTSAFLKDYARRHFQAEEAFMDRHGFPGLEDHKRLHTAFLEGLDSLLHDLQVFGPSQHLADRALEIAQDWLLDHIISMGVAGHTQLYPRPLSPWS